MLTGSIDFILSIDLLEVNLISTSLPKALCSVGWFRGLGVGLEGSCLLWVSQSKILGTPRKEAVRKSARFYYRHAHGFGRHSLKKKSVLC